ncbi:RING/U-box superfamily protein [Rhynchospora pubera]|uniref:RING-type E3 ubiquitin transferase n=1 Tax=Rhynchospora pubera TaxID=906938 RepID=A0AAV8C4U3_9POAL|nr:RING/U-box superfamily protein [Rhynchospora pubera]
MDHYHLNTKPNNVFTVIFLVFSFLLLTVMPVQAQVAGNSPNNSTTTSFNLTFALIFIALIILFFVTAFLIIFFSCGGPPRTAHPMVPTTFNENGAAWVIPIVRQSGLDRSVLEKFPIMKFSEVKGLIPGTLECAVCLSEYNDSDTLRILPGCCHVFHTDCIDHWLSNHDACPVCRASLTNPNIISTEPQSGTGNVGATTEDERHKMSMSMEGTDRFTLRLPDHVLRQIEVQRGYKLSASIAGSGYQGTPMSKSGRVWSFIRTFSSRRGLEFGGGSRSIRLGGSLRRNPTLGRNGSMHHTAMVRSGSVRGQVDGRASGMIPVRSGSARGENHMVASSTVLPQSGSVRGQTDMVASTIGIVRSGSVRNQTNIITSSTDPIQSGTAIGQTDKVASASVRSGSVRGEANMVASGGTLPVHELDQV